MRLSCCAVLAVLAAAGCEDTTDGLHPVGTTAATSAQLERFVRRLHLDLAAKPPSDDDLATESQALADGINSVASRRALAEELIGKPEFADVFVSELENRAYGGDTAANRYDFVCGLARITPPCDQCAPPDPTDYCAGCSCPTLVNYEAERTDLAATRADLAAGASTSSIERRYADTDGFQALSGSFEAIATEVIKVFLGRTPQADELDNAAAMARGPLSPGAKAGLLYHRLGSTYQDLLDIVFQDEIYREAMATAAFQRYLGRPPTPPELRHFAGMIDPTDPDLRPVILAITSSREYFQP